KESVGQSGRSDATDLVGDEVHVPEVAVGAEGDLSRKEEPKTGKKGTRNGNLANLTSRSDTAEVWGMLNAPRGGALDFRRHIRREPEVAVGPKRPTTAEDSAQGELG